MFGNSAKTNGTASRPSGMDMMIQSVIKAMGVQPDALTGYIEQGKLLATQFVGAMQQTANRLTEIETELKAQRALLERIANLEREVEQWRTNAQKTL